VVHFLGSVETYAPFMYLVHIVLACIFFSAPLSVAVTALACALYVMCVACEHLALVPPSTIYASVRPPLALGELVVVVLSAIAIWLVVWYLASRLAGRLRKREFELFHKNRRLVALQVERTRHMLRTTHELKAPFAAIAANAQLLLKGSYGALPPGAVEVVQRIAARCRRLAHEIQEMLQLANLESAHEAPPRTELDLADIARWAVSHVGPSARERGVTVEAELARTPASVVEDHMKMLLGNIVGNAVIYSHDGGVVRLACHPEGDGGATIIVEDEGIGIARAKLPRIFDEYYRTEEAAKHNKDSTGLGLAICRHVAQAHRIGLLVESEQGRGTRLTLRFPPQPTKKGGVPWLTL
jgi:signal transduction histidine kinase